jgi:threonine aldolase
MLGRYTTGPERRGMARIAEGGPILALPMPRTDPLIDLRSDTVTHPSPEMRRAMAEAELGDDVFGDDPTVIALEERAAELTGKEAGLFVASGSMGNLVSLMAHVPRGGEIIAESEAHTVEDEAAGHAVVVGASIRTLRADADGHMDPEAIREAFRDPTDPHHPVTALISLENTHSHSGGQPLDAAYTAEVARVAHEGGVPLHVDGARIFNAAVALGVPVRELLGPADSGTFCLSKGLACPVGSVVVGPRDFVRRARRARKLLGGGMRQAGVLAAPGLIALGDGPSGMIERLAEDHANARRLAGALAEMTGISGVDPARVRTNFVIFRVGSRAAFLERLAGRDVLMVEYPHDQIRAVTHYGVERPDVDRVIDAVRGVLTELGISRTPAVPVA